jgi:hypothetical protein
MAHQGSIPVDLPQEVKRVVTNIHTNPPYSAELDLGVDADAEAVDVDPLDQLAFLVSFLVIMSDGDAGGWMGGRFEPQHDHRREKEAFAIHRSCCCGITDVEQAPQRQSAWAYGSN